MVPIYFDYEETSKEYIYSETSVQYRMSYQMMLKFKKYLRNQVHGADTPPIKGWFLTLNDKELQEVKIIEKLPEIQQNSSDKSFPMAVNY